MTTFVDYVSATSTGKITCVRRAKAFYEDPTPYEVRAFYRGLKSAVAKCFEADGDRLALDELLSTTADAKKAKSYAANVAGLKRWMGRKDFEWVGTQRREWSSGDLRVSVNPELALRIDGEAHIIKLHLKGEQLAKRAIDPALHLLHVTHGQEGRVGILDARQGKLIVPTRSVAGVDALLRAEAASFATLWNDL